MLSFFINTIPKLSLEGKLEYDAKGGFKRKVGFKETLLSATWTDGVIPKNNIASTLCIFLKR